MPNLIYRRAIGVHVVMVSRVFLGFLALAFYLHSAVGGSFVL